MTTKEQDRYTAALRRAHRKREDEIRQLLNLLSEPAVVLRIREIASEVAIPGPAGPMGPPAAPVDAVSRSVAP